MATRARQPARKPSVSEDKSRTEGVSAPDAGNAAVQEQIGPAPAEASPILERVEPAGAGPAAETSGPTSESPSSGSPTPASQGPAGRESGGAELEAPEATGASLEGVGGGPQDHAAPPPAGAGAPGGGDGEGGDNGGDPGAAAALHAAAGGGGGGEGAGGPPAGSPPPTGGGGAPAGGGGAPRGAPSGAGAPGGGGGGGSPAGSGPAMAPGGGGASVAATAVTGDSVSGLMSAFSNAAPTVQAASWATLGGDLGSLAGTETEATQASLPELHATLAGEGTQEPGTEIAKVQADKGAVDDNPAATPDPQIEETPDPGSFSVMDSFSSFFSGWMGGEGQDTSSNAGAIGSAISSLPSSDSDIGTSAGPRPPVPASGETDPSRVDDKATAAAGEITAGAGTARENLVASPGAEQVQLDTFDEAFSVDAIVAPMIGESTPVPEIDEFLATQVDGQVLATFDAINHAEFSATMMEASVEVDAAVTERDLGAQAEIDAALAETEAKRVEAQADQEAAVNERRAEIEGHRADTLASYEAEATSAQAEVTRESAARRREIDARIARDNEEITRKYDEAERKASDKVAEGERKAAAEKAKAEKESEDKSWWEAAVDWVEDAIAAVADLISDIFNAIRDAVTSILDAVKSVANAIIDAAVSFIQSAISAFGELLKFAIDRLIGTVFPELAKKLKDAVDQAVTAANAAVQQIGDGLKEAVAAACDALKAGINAVLDVFEGALKAGLALATALVTGNWGAFLFQLLESALQILGIDKEQFYAYVGKAEETIDVIVNDPGAFVGNVIDAMGMGFGQFSDNFLTHLQTGFVEWLTGQAGDAGITMPASLDLAGIFDIVLQVMGLTPDHLKEKAAEHIGEDNVALLEHVWGYVSAFIEGGLGGLWEQLQGDLSSLYDMVVGQIQDWLMEKIVVAAVTKIASMFTPVGALVQAIMTVWDAVSWLREQASKIMGIFTSIVDSLNDIAMGNLGNAADMVEGALAGLIAPAISLLANLLGLGGIGKRVREIIEGVQEMVDQAIDKLFEKIKGMFGGSNSAEEQETAEQAPVDEAQGPGDEALLTEGNWGTQAPLMYSFTEPGKDREIANLRAHGTWKLEVKDDTKAAAQFKRGDGEAARWNNGELSEMMRSLVVSKLTPVVANAHMPVVDVVSGQANTGFGQATAAAVQSDLAGFGLGAKSITVLSVTTGDEVAGGQDAAGAEQNGAGADGSGPLPSVPFTDAGGESHRVYAVAAGQDAEVMVASEHPEKVPDAIEPAGHMKEAENKEKIKALYAEINTLLDDVLKIEKEGVAGNNAFADPTAEGTRRDAAAAGAAEKRRQAEAKLRELAGLLGTAGAGASDDLKKQVRDELKGAPDAEKVVEHIPEHSAAGQAAGAPVDVAQLRGQAHQSWAAKGADSYVHSVVGLFTDATAKRKLIEVDNEGQDRAKAAKGKFLDSMAQAVPGSLNIKEAEPKAGWLFGLMQKASVPLAHLGTEVTISGTLWRVAGLNRFMQSNLADNYKNNVFEKYILPELRAAVASVSPSTDVAQKKMQAWGKLDEKTEKQVLIEEYLKAKGTFPDGLSGSDLAGKVTGNNNTAWWTDHDYKESAEFKAAGGDSLQEFGAFCQLGALQPSWYPGGSISFSTNGQPIKASKPTVFDGMMSEYWVQTNDNNLWGVTGGGEREWISKGSDLDASILEPASVTMHITGHTWDAVKAKFLANIENPDRDNDDLLSSTDQVNANEAALKKYNGENTNEEIVQGTATAPTSGDAGEQMAHDMNQRVATPMNPRIQQSEGNGGTLGEDAKKKLGVKISIMTKDGPHEVWVETGDGKPVMYMASTPRPLAETLDNLRREAERRLSSPERAGRLAEVLKLLDEALGLEKQTDVAAEKAINEAKKEAATDPTAPVQSKKQKMASLLVKILNALYDGNEVVERAVERGTNEDEQLERAQSMANFAVASNKDPGKMSSVEMDEIIRGHSILLEEKDQSDQKIRKVVPEAQVNKYLVNSKYTDDKGEHQDSLMGSVATSSMTEGLGSHETQDSLGLDYSLSPTDKKGSNPYYKEDGKGGFNPADEVHFIETDMDDGIKKAAKVPLDPKIIAHAQSNAAKDPDAAKVLANSVPSNSDDSNAKTAGKKDDVHSNPFNPYKGTGKTGGAEGTGRAEEGAETVNQELFIHRDDKQTLKQGTKLYKLDKDGNKVLVAELESTLDKNNNPTTKWKEKVDDPDVELEYKRDARTTLENVGLNWFTAKAKYAKDKRWHPVMRKLIDFRRDEVNHLANDVKGTTNTTWKSVGSESLTSDYDLTFAGEKEVEAVKEFNAKFRANFRKEPGSVFDTNAYTAGEFVPAVVKDDKGKDVKSGKKNAKGDDLVEIKDENQIFANEVTQKADQEVQDIASMVKTRKFMTNLEWGNFKRKQRNALKGQDEQLEALEQRFVEVERLYQDSEAALVDEMKELEKIAEETDKALAKADPSGKSSIPMSEEEKRLAASNSLYVKKLELAKEAAKERNDFKAKHPNMTDEQKKQWEKLVVRAKRLQSEALMFANEPYFSEGAIRHVVGGQAKMDIELSAQNLLSSFQEQLGDTLKDLDHYGDDLVTAAVQSSKYAQRLIDAGKQLSVKANFKMPRSTTALTAMVDSLLAIRRDEKVSGKEREEKATQHLETSGLLKGETKPIKADQDPRVLELRKVFLKFGGDIVKETRKAMAESA